MRLPLRNSQPCAPRSHGTAERNNWGILAAARTALVGTGIPACFWPHVWICVRFLRNQARSLKAGGDVPRSPGARAHKCAELKATMFPSGCGVWFKPPTTRPGPSKWEARARWGTFAGYSTTPGGGWNGDCLVWDLDQFHDIPFEADASSMYVRNFEPHVARVVKLPVDEPKLVFLLLRRYRAANQTLSDLGLGPFEGPAGPPERPLHREERFDVPHEGWPVTLRLRSMLSTQTRPFWRGG